MNLILDAREFRLLEGLRLNPRRTFSGRVRGERLTVRKGVSIEFADYREYSEGDDLRHLDWNVLARLDTPVMRTYRDEEDLAVHLLIDGSPSMDFGATTKFSFARQLGMALGYVALCGGDSVMARALGLRSETRPLRGRVSYGRLASWAGALEPLADSGERLSMQLRAFAGSSARPGIVVILSDGLDLDAAGAIRVLGGRGHEVWLIQVLSDVELDPDLEGDLRLIDNEGGSAREITANRSVLETYREALRRHNQELKDAVLRIGGRYALVTPSTSIDQSLRDVFKREGWLQ